MSVLKSWWCWSCAVYNNEYKVDRIKMILDIHNILVDNIDQFIIYLTQYLCDNCYHNTGSSVLYQKNIHDEIIDLAIDFNNSYNKIKEEGRSNYV